MDIPTRLIIGLGNPGEDYARTRHNAGFLVIDEIGKRHGIPVTRRQHRALIGDGRVGDARVFLMKPQTFMNLSGESVGLFLRQKPLELGHILVVSDDIALPLGKLRLRGAGSAGGHNGLKSIIEHLQSTEFPRLRLGVGAPRDPSVQISHVLGAFARQEQAEVVEMVERAADGVEAWLTQPLELAMNRVNTG